MTSVSSRNAPDADISPLQDTHWQHSAERTPRPAFRGTSKVAMHRRVLLIIATTLCIFFLFLAGRQATIDGSYTPQIPEWTRYGRSPLDTKKVAALMETRATPNLVPIVLHFASVLGPTWPIKIFTTEDLQLKMEQSKPLSRKVEDGSLQFVRLPETASFKEHAAVSAFLTKEWFWEQLLPAERVLMFQPDSILCSNSEQTVDDFLEYDFIGSPVRKEFGSGYNGGLSVRNVPLILDIIRSGGNWTYDRAHNKKKYKANIDYEDQWFYAKMLERGDMNFPDEEVAGRFAVETIWKDEPLGYHQANVWQASNMTKILEWCPEYTMCTAETYKNH